MKVTDTASLQNVFKLKYEEKIISFLKNFAIDYSFYNFSHFYFENLLFFSKCKCSFHLKYECNLKNWFA